MMHWGSYGAMGYGGSLMGWIFMVLVWTFVILGVFYLLKLLFGKGVQEGGSPSAEEILKRKFASGEITRVEYHEKLSVIRSSPGKSI